MPYRDFDAFIASQDEGKEPITFKMFGQEFKTKGKIPFVAVLKAQELDQDEPDIGAIADVMQMMIGRDNWSRLVEMDIDIMTAIELVMWIMNEAMDRVGAPEVDDEGKPARVSRSPLPTSSGSGEPSKETSAVSMGLGPPN